MIVPTEHGLYCEAGGFHIDPWRPVPRAVITHAHGDHLRPGSDAYLCATSAMPSVQHRLPQGASVTGLDWGVAVDMKGVRVSLHPAGHVLGSAQVRLEHRGEVWVVSGDYKRAPDPTCVPWEPVRCHTFVTESTFGLPIFHWDPPAVVIDEIVAWWDEMALAGRPAVLFVYALGKAQRVLAELRSRTDRAVFVHGGLTALIDLYRGAGVMMADTRVATGEMRGRSFAGALVLAPVLARGSVWMRRFANHSSAFASGWMRIRGARRRRGYDRGFVLSDHADWGGLLQTVHDTGASRVFVTHGHTGPFTRYLQDRGLDAHAWSTRFEGEPEGESTA